MEPYDRHCSNPCLDTSLVTSAWYSGIPIWWIFGEISFLIQYWSFSLSGCYTLSALKHHILLLPHITIANSYRSDISYDKQIVMRTCFDLGSRLETTVYPVIRHKLSKALVNWHPSDRSAKLMLLPWHGVFSKGDMDAFLIKNIVPKLQLALQELVINPHQQHLGEDNLLHGAESFLRLQ